MVAGGAGEAAGYAAWAASAGVKEQSLDAPGMAARDCGGDAGGVAAYEQPQ